MKNFSKRLVSGALTCYTVTKETEGGDMIIFYSILAGLAWGGLFGLFSALITGKIAAGDANRLAALSMLRMLVDLAALAAVYFTRELLPLRFEFTLIATAVALSLVGIVAAFRAAAALKK